MLMQWHLSFRGALPLWAVFCLAACSWTAIYLYYINYGLDEAKYDTFFSGSVAGINCQFVVIGLTYLALALVAELLLLRDLAVLESSDEDLPRKSRFGDTILRRGSAFALRRGSCIRASQFDATTTSPFHVDFRSLVSPSLENEGLFPVGSASQKQQADVPKPLVVDDPPIIPKSSEIQFVSTRVGGREDRGGGGGGGGSSFSSFSDDGNVQGADKATIPPLLESKDEVVPVKSAHMLDWVLHWATSTLQRRPLVLFLRTAVLAGFIYAAFVFNLKFALFFVHHNKNIHDVILMTFVFWLVEEIGMFLAMLIGRWIDRARAEGLVAMEVIGWLMICIYKEVFFINMFSQVNSWGTFLALKALHSLLVSGTAVVLLSPEFGKIHNGLRESSPLYQGIMPTFVAQRTALCIAVEGVLTVQIYIAYVFFWTVLRHSYNRRYFIVIDMFSDEQYVQLYYFIVVGIAVECVQLYCINKFSSTSPIITKQVASLVAPWLIFFKREPAYMWFFIWSVGHATTDVFLATLKCSAD
jgi:hypothetical protein